MRINSLAVFLVIMFGGIVGFMFLQIFGENYSANILKWGKFFTALVISYGILFSLASIPDKTKNETLSWICGIIVFVGYFPLFIVQLIIFAHLMSS